MSKHDHDDFSYLGSVFLLGFCLFVCKTLLHNIYFVPIFSVFMILPLSFFRRITASVLDFPVLRSFPVWASTSAGELVIGRALIMAK